MNDGIFIAVFAITGGLGVAVLGMWFDRRNKELRHIERMAMIEKGMVPPDMADSIVETRPLGPRARRGQRGSGVFMICLGIGLSLMFWLQSGRVSNVWIGAMLVMIGAANLINSLLDDRDARQRSAPAGPNQGTPV